MGKINDIKEFGCRSWEGRCVDSVTLPNNEKINEQ